MAECQDNLLQYQRYVGKFVSFNFLFLKVLYYNTFSVKVVWTVLEKSSTEREMHLVVQENY